MNHSLLSRMIRAARLDVSLYEEVEKDPRATVQAMLVVILTSLAAGVGLLGKSEVFGPFAFFFGTVSALVSWVVWSLVTYLIGTKLLPMPGTSSSLGEMLRTTGFSTAPAMIRALGVVPGLWIPSLVLATVWVLISMVIAVRQALDYESTGRAIAVCVMGLGFAMIVGWLLSGSPLEGVTR